MLHTVVIKNRKASIAPYFRGNTMGSKAVYNTANFLIRNVMTAVSKDSDKWTDNEREVMERVETARCAYNAFRKTHALSKGKKVPEPMEAPCKGRWMLSYGFLDFLLKTEKNEAYYSCTSQVNQQAIRKVIRAWKSYFALLKKYKDDPASLKERPHIPRYIRKAETTAHFPNQVCRLETDDTGKGVLHFANHREPYPIGNTPCKISRQ